jgi:predicted kinase
MPALMVAFGIDRSAANYVGGLCRERVGSRREPNRHRRRHRYGLFRAGGAGTGVVRISEPRASELLSTSFYRYLVHSGRGGRGVGPCWALLRRRGRALHCRVNSWLRHQTGAMGRLLLINGAPSSGKSTLARCFVRDHPLALALDIDRVRSMLGGWLEQPTEAGLAARRLAMAMAHAHLSAGHDVVVPQYLGRLQFVLELEAVADQVGVDFVQIALVSDPGDAAARFARRIDRPENDEHRDAAVLQERNGGSAGLVEMYERMLRVTAARPSTRSVVTVDGEIEPTYRRMLEQLGC